ncbi:MAG TPA: cytosine permease [Steroidobacteraceae bacterium]|nr:cytosine permease [Steroidobacteraceae bacterium]
MAIESRSIDFVPEAERHGRVRDQGPFWFLSNFHFFAIAIGFVGPSLGLSLRATASAGILGIIIGTALQAFHASQGAEMGLPQMIQSRAQFGYRGVIVPLIATLISLVGYNVVSTVLVSEGAAALWGFNREVVAIGLSVLAALLAIWGYDWLHRAFKVMFWISLPLFTLLTLAIFTGAAGGTTPTHSTFTWAAFVTQMASAASFNVTAAPYVSDYSRYLPTRTSRARIIANVFAGSASSAIWLIIVGAWLATRLGATDGLLALHQTGDVLWPHLGSVLAAVSIAALFTTCGMNAYSAMLTFVTICDSLRRVRPTRALRINVIAGVTVLWITVAVGFGGNAVTYVNTMLVLMLYFLIPWSAVNLIDYFYLRKGRYSIPDLFEPDGMYGAWNARGLLAYAVGFTVSIPFFVVPNVYTGPLARLMGGVDIGWLISALASSATYLVARFPVAQTRLTAPQIPP